MFARSLELQLGGGRITPSICKYNMSLLYLGLDL